MEIVRLRFPYKGRLDEWSIIPLGDIHMGAKGCDEKALDETVAAIAKDDRALVVLMGDLCECIVGNDPRWDAKAVADWCFEPANRARIAEAQAERVLSVLQHIPKERVIGVLEGNHESAIRNHHHMDLTLDIARKLGVPYLAQEAFIQVTFAVPNEKRGAVGTTSRTFDLFVTHGSGGGRKPGGKVNKLVDTEAFIDADILFMGHHHDRVATRTVKLGIDQRGNFIHKERVQVLTGTFLKTYQEGSPSYAARGLYPPTAIGSPVVKIRPFDRHIEVVT